MLTDSTRNTFVGLKGDMTKKKKKKQEGHDGPGSLTWVSLEPNYFKICPTI